MRDSSTTPPDDRPDLPGDETVPVEARKDTLAVSGGTDFRHGRFEPGERLGSRYRIVARLGEGGMGEVYRADDLELGQSVALKFLPERVAADESWLRRFRNEVRTARQIAHPNVCRIYDIGQVDGHVFLSMEYVDGEDLAGVLRRLGRPSREKAIEIARQICLGLAAAHDSKVLHRDLKPANIMIDGRGRVRITDFGLAGFLDELEGVEARAGTPAYMAPEQLTHGKVSVQSDIYTLGLILHELFTGKCVFETNDIEELKRKHTSGSVTPPSTITDEIDPAVERVIMRCLREVPSERPDSVYQVLAALPGGDPLSAALAAGETPSPELVANARDAGGLSPAVAIGLLGAIVVSLTIACLAYAGTFVMPERSPAVLSVIAGQIMDELGYADLPRHSVVGYDLNADLAAALRTSPRSPDEVASTGWPPPYRFWRRWTEGEFVPHYFHSPQLFKLAGMTTTPEETAAVALDASGRLLGLAVAPALSGEVAVPVGDVDWSSVLQRAELTEATMTPVALVKQPPVHCERLVAWRAEPTGSGVEPLTVQLGASGGRANYFEILDLDAWMTNSNLQTWATTFSVDPEFVRLGILVFLIILALHNLRAGRGDRRSAVRFALIIAGLYTLLELVSFSFGAPVTPARAIEFVKNRSIGHIILHALEAWVFYMAVEPYVRRVWPHMLVGVVRLLSGRWRDPAVGREVLIGVVTGCGLVAALATIGWVHARVRGGEVSQLPHPSVLWSTVSPLHFLSMKAHRAAWAAMDSAFIVGLLVALRLLTRHTTTAVALGILGLGTMGYFWGRQSGMHDASIWIDVTYPLLGCIALVLLYTKVGILAAIVASFVAAPAGLFAAGFGHWFSRYGAAELAMLVALTAYGFWVSLAGQPIFKDMLAEPQAAVR